MEVKGASAPVNGIIEDTEEYECDDGKSNNVIKGQLRISEIHRYQDNKLNDLDNKCSNLYRNLEKLDKDIAMLSEKITKLERDVQELKDKRKWFVK
jgi:peptidoglycan hydrolase CwlO-like protein